MHEKTPLSPCRKVGTRRPSRSPHASDQPYVLQVSPYVNSPQQLSETYKEMILKFIWKKEFSHNQESSEKEEQLPGALWEHGAPSVRQVRSRCGGPGPLSVGTACQTSREETARFLQGLGEADADPRFISSTQICAVLDRGVKDHPVLCPSCTASLLNVCCTFRAQVRSRRACGRSPLVWSLLVQLLALGAPPSPCRL